MVSPDAATIVNKAPALKKAKQAFTQLLVGSLQCPYGKSQALYWDKATPNLGLRVTASGYKSYIFESSLHNKTIRITLGSIHTCPLAEARERTASLKALVNKGIDPRKLSGKKAAPFTSKKQIVEKTQANDTLLAKHLSHPDLAAWFSAVNQIDNPEISAYLKVLLLSGRRKDEVTNLTWDAIDFEQETIVITNQNNQRKQIPLTNHVKALLENLPKTRTAAIFKPTISQLEAAHDMICQSINMPLSLETLRTSFTLYADLVETPFGITAQLQDIAIMGISADQFNKRPMSVLRTWHQKVENWILDKAILETAK